MKNTLLLFFVFLLLISCNKGERYTKATMIGKDLTLCACCGGYYFKIKNDTFLAKEYVESNIFNSEELLPKKVKIKYAKVEDKCSSGKDVIKITAIKRD